MTDETNLTSTQSSEIPPSGNDDSARRPTAILPGEQDAQEAAAGLQGDTEEVVQASSWTGEATPAGNAAPAVASAPSAEGGEPIAEESAAVEPSAELPSHDAPSTAAPPETAHHVANELVSDAASAADASTVEAGTVEAGARESSAAESAAPKAKTVEAEAEEPKSDKMDWYILKVQSNREESAREALRKKIKIAGLERFFGEIIIPTEKVTEFKGGKRKVFKRKLYPGYLVVQMEINEETWFLVRDTSGVGDFTGAGGHPTPMQPHEVAAILAKQEERTDEAPKLKIAFRVGDRVKIKEGTFENFEGEVANIDETNGRVTVLINIFGRSTPVDIDYWQIETV